MQMHIGYTVVYSVFILAKQLNVIIEFTSVTFPKYIYNPKYTAILIAEIAFTNEIGLNLVEQINQ